MAAKKRGLGRGLDALLGGSVKQTRPAEIVKNATEAPQEVSYKSYTTLPVDQKHRGKNHPRPNKMKNQWMDK